MRNKLLGCLYLVVFFVLFAYLSGWGWEFFIILGEAIGLLVLFITGMWLIAGD